MAGLENRGSKNQMVMIVCQVLSKVRSSQVRLFNDAKRQRYL